MTDKPKKYCKHFAATIEDFTRTLLPFSASMRQYQTACSKPPETQGAKLLGLSLSPPKSLFFFPARKMRRKKEKAMFSASFVPVTLSRFPLLPRRREPYHTASRRHYDLRFRTPTDVICKASCTEKDLQ
jgi:hypothetical protein